MNFTFENTNWHPYTKNRYARQQRTHVFLSIYHQMLSQVNNKVTVQSLSVKLVPWVQTVYV